MEKVNYKIGLEVVVVKNEDLFFKNDSGKIFKIKRVLSHYPTPHYKGTWYVVEKLGRSFPEELLIPNTKAGSILYGQSNN